MHTTKHRFKSNVFFLIHTDASADHATSTQYFFHSLASGFAAGPSDAAMSTLWSELITCGRACVSSILIPNEKRDIEIHSLHV